MGSAGSIADDARPDGSLSSILQKKMQEACDAGAIEAAINDMKEKPEDTLVFVWINWTDLGGKRYLRDNDWMSLITINILECIWVFHGVSKNRCTPKSSILMGVSIINHPLLGALFLETPI